MVITFLLKTYSYIETFYSYLRKSSWNFVVPSFKNLGEDRFLWILNFPRNLTSIRLYMKLFTKLTLSQTLIEFFIFCKKQLIVYALNFQIKTIVNLFKKKSLISYLYHLYIFQLSIVKFGVCSYCYFIYF